MVRMIYCIIRGGRNMLAAFIMAGGSGERFWPLSTKERPKQLLNLIDDRSMIRMTVDRILPMIPAENIFVGTNEIQAKAIAEELPMIPAENIIIEPAFKDTAAAIGYGTIKINEQLKKNNEESENATIVVLAADHLIKNEENFRKRLETAVREAEKGYIITLGIKPTKPETGYGYIETDECYIGEATKVKRFWEKPNLERAEEYLAAGNYLWNSGMFVFPSNIILGELEKYMEDHYKTLLTIKENIDNEEKIKEEFEKFEKISIDFGVMEKSTLIKVIPVDFGWNDIGSFPALEDVYDPDESGNIKKDVEYRQIHSRDNIVIGKGKRVSTIGVKDMVIVQSDDEILICHKSRAQDIKKIIKL